MLSHYPRGHRRGEQPRYGRDGVGDGEGEASVRGREVSVVGHVAGAGGGAEEERESDGGDGEWGRVCGDEEQGVRVRLG